MTKRCFSIMTPDFEKSIKALDADQRKKLKSQISELENMENDHTLVPEGKISAASHFGKTLSKVNRNIYCMEIGTDRALAVIIKKEDKKIYAWFWGGPHEEYNKMYKKQNVLDKKENQVASTNSAEITEKIEEIKVQEKTQVIDKIKGTREKYQSPKDDWHHKKKY